MSCLMVCIPFAIGGYYTITASVLLIACLLFLLKKRQIRIYFSFGFVGVLLLWLTSVFCPIWAKDPVMAAIQSVKYWVLFIFSIVLMQFSEKRSNTLLCVNVQSAVWMTVACLILAYIPSVSNLVLVYGNFSGLFEYANTYALFLLIAVNLLLQKEKLSIVDIISLFILIFGISLTNSRTSSLLLIVSILLVFVKDRKWNKSVQISIICLMAMMAACFISQNFSPFMSGEDSVTEGGSSFLTRLLYWKDALNIILHNPLGIGPMGYATERSAVQTGVYAVMYVHNELLQLLIDFGWIPVFVLCLAAGKQIFSSQRPNQNRWLLIVILAHCMMDFDLQYLTIWMCLLPLLGLTQGKEYTLDLNKIPLRICACFISLFGLWFGLSDYLYFTQDIDRCLAVMPVHTLALEEKLQQTSDAAEIETIAEKIIQINPDVSIAHSAKANVAFTQGNVLEMMEEKERAIETNPYFLEEYVDYFEKLDYILQLYYRQGDLDSAVYCLKKMQNIPIMLEDLKERSSDIAWKIEHTPQVELPDIYLERLEQWEILVAP